MKLFEELEPQLRRWINPKRAKRNSCKVHKKLRNRSVRRELNRDFNQGKEILTRRLGHEY